MLQSIALKVVGSIADAEDIVQDTFLKWLTIDQKSIQNTKAYLVKSVTNNCINHINSFKSRSVECLESLTNKSSFFEKGKEREMFKFDFDNEVTEALAVLGKKLEPIEKGIYLLREVFNFEYDDLQELFDKKKENCRQIFSRVQAKLKDDTAKSGFDKPSHGKLVNNFNKACNSGQFSELLAGIKKEIDQRFPAKKNN